MSAISGRAALRFARPLPTSQDPCGRDECEGLSLMHESRMREICTSGSASRKGGHIQQGRPAEARIRSLVAWIAKWRETETLKPIDDAIVRMVANHQAVARANADVASKVSRSGGRARNREGEGSMVHRELIDAMSHSGGVEATAW